MHDIAFAKINLALHVRRRRADGYHELETLFAFVDNGDRIAIDPAADNLVTRAARLAHGGALPALRIAVDKRLPVAAGLGGGSADAGAVLRMLGMDEPARAAVLGADVPACIASVPVIGMGTGTELAAVGDNDVRGMACLLVNPRLPVPTGPVFRAWDGVDRGAMPAGSARAIMVAGRNDLEAPAVALCPPIAEVLAALRGAGPVVARMSGSGATCFALWDAAAARDDAAARIAAAQPGWWQMAGALR